MSDLQQAHAERITRMKQDIFRKVGQTLVRDGEYVHVNKEARGEYCASVPELGDLAICLSNSGPDRHDILDFYNELHLTWSRPERNRVAFFWITRSEIEVQYGTMEDTPPKDITDRHQIHPEALIELHEVLTKESTS